MLLLPAVLLSTALVPSPPEPIDSILARLESLDKVSFTYRRILDYKAPAYHHDGTWRVVGEVQREGALPFKRLWVENKDFGASGYDGRVYWSKDASDGKVRGTVEPKPTEFDDMSALRNNIFGLSRSLRAALKADPLSVRAIPDAGAHVVLEWDCVKSRPTISVPLEPMEVSCRFRMEFDKMSWLPIKITQFLVQEGDTITTMFSGWNLAPKVSDDLFAPPKG